MVSLLVVFFIITPSGLEQGSNLGEKGVQVANVYNQVADEPALQTPLPAIVMWVVLTGWTLYVSLMVKES